jgi:hypothetical protein
MAKADIFCVGVDLPGVEFEYVPFNSGMSLLDADIVIYEPTLDYRTDSLHPTYQGLPSLSAESSVETRKSISHWHTELKTAFEAGKTVFVLLTKPIEVYAKTGTQELSGTGRSQKVIYHVSPVDSYMSLPTTFKSLTAAKGRKVKLTNDGRILAPYIKAMSDLLHYEVHYEHEKSQTLMVTKSGDRAVASLIRGKAGSMVLLPALDFTDDDFTDYTDPYAPKWTKKALRYGHALSACLVELHKALRAGSSRTPAPDWAKSETYSLSTEIKIGKRIAEIDDRMRGLSEERRECEARKELESMPKALLYETGKPLEAAIIDALRTFGFEADHYVDEDSEFDVLFESAEGRFLGEAEGKDSSAVNIDKIQQLERNLQEDFSKDGVDEFAKGILFGNPHRLTSPDSRGELFTKKAIAAAERTGIGLVHTPDLFPLVKYLKTKNNAKFKKSIRKAFSEASGKIISFSEVPNKVRAKKSAEQPPAGDVLKAAPEE